MGYRSQVRCLIYGTKDQLDAFVITHQLILSSPAFTHFKESLTRYSLKYSNKEYHCLDLYGDYWKWYPEYSDVQSWEALMKDASEVGLNYEFLRIGEGDGDQQDVETDRSFNAEYLLQIGRPTIEENFEKQEEIPLL